MSRIEKRKYKHISIDRFMKQKKVVAILGFDYQLSDVQKKRLQKVLNEFSEYEIVSCEQDKNIAFMIQNDVINYYGRLKRLKTLKKEGKYSTSLYAYFLRYGKKKYMETYLQKKDKHIRNLPNQIDYWLRKGYSEEEAKEEISKFNTNVSKYSAEKIRGHSEYSCRSKKYWLRKGYSEEEAKEEIKRICGVGSKEQFIKRYGETEGLKKWEERQIKWQNTLNLKSDEEKILINKKKNHTIESYILNGLSEEEARKKSYEYYNKRKNYSNISQKFFELLDENLNHNTYYKIKNYEQQFNGCNVDFFDKNMNIVIEFNGDYWHGRKGKYDDDFVIYGKTAKERRDYDDNRYKKILNSDKVKDIIIIWESDFRKKPDIIVQKTLEMMEKMYESRDENNSKRIKEVIY